MKKIRRFIRNYFGFSQKETNGFIMLIFLMVIMVFVPGLADRLSSSTANYEHDRQIIDRLSAEIEANRTKRYEKKPDYGNVKPADKKYTLFKFDPNTATVDQFIQLGLRQYLAERIINYRSKGGEFRIKSDLNKIYGFPEFLYKRLYPYISLPNTKENSYESKSEEYKYKAYSSKKNFKKKTIAKFDINTADTAAIKQIRGIGSILSDRIINYRNTLGGFINKNQLSEVYGLKPETLQELSKFIYINDDFQPEKININTADLTALKKHPYMDYKIARIVIAYRKEHGSFKSVEDLKKVKLMTQEKIKKLLPYLSF